MGFDGHPVFSVAAAAAAAGQASAISSQNRFFEADGGQVMKLEPGMQAAPGLGFARVVLPRGGNLKAMLPY